MPHQMRLTLHRIAVVGAMTGVSLIGSAPVEAQSLQGHVEQNAAPSEVFEFRSLPKDRASSSTRKDRVKSLSTRKPAPRIMPG